MPVGRNRGKMKEFFTMLFFGSSLLLTPVPIDIGKEWVNLTPKKQIKAINCGAKLFLDITKSVGNIDAVGLLDKMLPAGTIEAELIPETGPSYVLRNSSAYGFSDNKVLAILMADSVPLNIKFNKVRLRSSIRLKSVTVTWMNYSL